jgi:CBS-domain-containing membrane protein
VLSIFWSDSGVNFWNILIGWFLLQNAGQAAQYATFQDQLAGLTAANAVAVESPIVEASQTLRKFADQQVLGQRNWRKFLVTDDGGRLMGTIAVDDLKTIPSDRWADTPVESLVMPIASSLTVESDRPLVEVVKFLEEHKLNAISVVGANGVLVGLLEKTAVIQLLQNRKVTAPALAS